MQMIPFDNRDGYIWFNGSLIEWNKAQVHILNHGLHYGSCVFEGIRIYDEKIFKLDEHIERLFKSAKILDLKIPYNLDEVISQTKNIVSKQGVRNGYIRPVVWRGSEMMAISAQKASTNIAIACWEWPSYFSPEKLMQGIKLSLSNWTRPSPSSAPTDSKAAGLYMICSLSKHEAEKKGFDDALMLDYRGYIAEATGANIFFVKKGELFTPIADCFLDGITRQAVIEIAKENNFLVNEGHYKPEFLTSCQEAFLTGTAVEITPIQSVDEYVFKERGVTSRLIKEFKKKVLGQ